MPPHDALPVRTARVDLLFRFEGVSASFLEGERAFFEGFSVPGGRPALVEVRGVRPGPARLPSALHRELAANLREVYARFPAAEDPGAAAGRALEWAGLLAGEEGVRAALEDHARAGLSARVFAPFPTGLLLLEPGGGGRLFLNVEAPESEQASLFRQGVYMGLSLALASSGGLALHGAGLRRGGRGYAFLGLSGAGKSTLARLAGPDAVLSDDGVCLRSAGGVFRVHATPFLQVEAEPGRRAEQARAGPPLAGLFFLEQGRTHGREPRHPADALSDILHHYVHFLRWFPEAPCRAAFATALRLVERHGAETLRFSEDAGFWDVIMPGDT